MPRFKLILEYDGAPFVGWQRQENGLSIQEALEEALAAMTAERATVHGAGRTDAGVHALGQVAHVDLEREWEPFRLGEGLNAMLHPHPIAVLKSERVSFRFRRQAQRPRPPLSLSHRQPPGAAGARARPRLAGEASPRRSRDARRRPGLGRPARFLHLSRRPMPGEIADPHPRAGSPSRATATRFKSKRARCRSCTARCARWSARWSRSASAGRPPAT